ncbi:MAG: succinate dehydrogenase [Pseudomonadota bacterium]
MSTLSPRLFIAQRVSALVMAPLVLGHIAVMIVAIQGGLDSAEILARTQGSLLWALFYGIFVLAVSVHAAIGMRVVASEWLTVSRGVLDTLSLALGLALLSLGTYAVIAVTLP